MNHDGVIKSIKAGDHSAFDMVFRRYYRPLCSFVYHIIGDPERVEDVVQDTFMAVWLRYKNFDSEQKLTSFLFVVARNMTINLLRSSDSKVVRGSLPDISAENFLENQLLIDEFDGKLRDWLGALPEKCRQVMELALADNKNQEIADKLKISVNTVKNQKAKGFKILASMYTSDYPLIILYATLFFMKN